MRDFFMMIPFHNLHMNLTLLSSPITIEYFDLYNSNKLLFIIKLT